MIPKVISAQYKRNFIVRVCFSDGKEGDVDLSKELYGEVFKPLNDIAVFKTVSVHPEFHTLYWSNGADMAPEFLYEKI